MAHVDALAQEHAADQQAAVAAHGVLFAAHQRNPKSGYPVEQAPNPFLEDRRCRDAIIPDIALKVVELRPIRAPPKFAPQEEILPTAPKHGPAKRILVKVRGVSRNRLRAHIHQHTYVVLVQEVQEPLGWVVGVTDGENVRAHPRLQGDYIKASATWARSRRILHPPKLGRHQPLTRAPRS